SERVGLDEALETLVVVALDEMDVRPRGDRAQRGKELVSPIQRHLGRASEARLLHPTTLRGEIQEVSQDDDGLGLFHSSNLNEQRHRLIVVEGLVRAVSQRPEPDLRVATLQAQLQAVYTGRPLGEGSDVDLDRLCRLHNGPLRRGLVVRELVPGTCRLIPDALSVETRVGLAPRKRASGLSVTPDS